jgi:Zn-dependent protease
MAVLQIFAVLINLIPMPPLDGFGIIEPYLDYETRMKMRQPAVAYIGLFILFFVVFRIDAVSDLFFKAMIGITDAVGLDREMLYGNYNLAFFGT